MIKPTITGNTIVVPSITDHLADVDLFVEGILRGWEVSESVIADIAISVSELVNNAICHGNKSEIEKTVSLRIERSDNKVTITVTDQGCGFDMSDVADPLADKNILKEVGRGLFIARSLMDSLEAKSTEAGTTISISKTID